MYKQTEKENVPFLSLPKITLKINYSLQFCILLFFFSPILFMCYLDF